MQLASIIFRKSPISYPDGLPSLNSRNHRVRGLIRSMPYHLKEGPWFPEVIGARKFKVQKNLRMIWKFGKSKFIMKPFEKRDCCVFPRKLRTYLHSSHKERANLQFYCTLAIISEATEQPHNQPASHSTGFQGWR